MRTLTTALMTVFVAAALVAHAGAQSSGIAVIVHPSNSVDSLSAAELESIFTSSRRHWNSGDNIVAFNYAPHHSTRVAFDRAVLRMEPSQVSRFWIDQRIRGRAGPPRQVPSPSLMVRVVERLTGAIGYAPMSEAKKGQVKIVAMVRGGKVFSR